MSFFLSSALFSVSARSARRGLVFAVGLLLVLFAGCDPSVSPVQAREDAQYSMFGYLDVHADSQWIRVDPLAGSDPQSFTDSLDARVVLTHVGTGESVDLENRISSSGSTRLFHLFLTTRPIQPNTRYRIEVIEDGETATFVETSTPGPRIRYAFDYRQSDAFGFTVGGVGVLAGSAYVLDLTNTCNRYNPVFQYDVDLLEISQEIEPGRFNLPIEYEQAVVDYDQESRPEEPGRCYYLADESTTLTLTVGGSDWPEREVTAGTDFSDLIVPDAFSNVEDGRGYVGGVATFRWTIDFSEQARVTRRSEGIVPIASDSGS